MQKWTDHFKINRAVKGKFNEMHVDILLAAMPLKFYI